MIPHSRMSQFPFQRVVISFPDERSAEAARQGPLQELSRHFSPSCRIEATCDPFNVRIGSGGGSLACISEVMDEAMDGDFRQESLLILHAGGASSRCPTQMVLGKAWTSLPTRSRSSGESGLQTPIHLWLKLCQDLFGESCLPRGSIVIVAADTILQLPQFDHGVLDWSQLENDAPCVVGIAVPAPLRTAKNHGVFVVETLSENDESVSSTVSIAPCRQVLQKPGLDVLQKVSLLNRSGGEDLAWIDTGVIIFLPQAADSLRKLAGLFEYTRKGMRRRQQCVSCEESSNCDAQCIVSLDLYTHLLQALRLEGSQQQTRTLDRYLEEWSHSIPTHLATPVYELLSPCRLYIACIPSGKFLHLGTTRELLDFLVLGSNHMRRRKEVDDDISSLSNPTAEMLREFGRQIQLCTRLMSFATYSQVDASSVVLHSLLKTHSSSSPVVIGRNTVIEHCHIETAASEPANPITIGRNCLVSGLRKYGSGVARDGFNLPDGMVLQQIALSGRSSIGTQHAFQAQCFVYMVLGVDDSIKECTNIYGTPFVHFFAVTGLTVDDIWSEETDRSLWTARIHPVVNAESFSDVFGWLHSFFRDEKITADSSFRLWKELPRLSLAEIRASSDASAESTFRSNIPKVVSMQRDLYVAQMRKALMTREHTMVDLQYFIDSYSSENDSESLSTNIIQALHLMDDIFIDALTERMYDVCGRVAMISSAFTFAAAAFAPTQKKIDSSILQRPALMGKRDNLLVSGASIDEMLASFRNFCRKKDKYLIFCPSVALLETSAALESIFSAMTRKCVIDSQPLVPSHTMEALQDQWVLSTAPVRLDVGGGWSDTPPVCYEFGSSVTGLAILVDGIKPLSCRCRIKSGGRDVFLRSEHRDGSTGELVCAKEAVLGDVEDIMDFCIPTADCALLKCALLCLGLVPIDGRSKDGKSFQDLINAFCQAKMDVGLEIVSSSLLPHGSGLGTSSILAGCVIASVGRAVGIDLSHDLTEHNQFSLVDAVLYLEQLLTTGGGFQDQVNGLIGGVKHVTCRRLEFPLYLDITRLKVGPEFRSKLNEAGLLLFTGQTRLAKNILQNVLRRWALRTPEIVETVKKLVENADHSRTAILDADLDALGQSLSCYWDLKKTMAGPEGGAEPPHIKVIFDLFRERDLVRGASLCGAGGGGFLAIIMKENTELNELKTILGSQMSVPQKLTWHKFQLCEDGLTTSVLDIGSVIDQIDAFDLDWLRGS